MLKYTIERNNDKAYNYYRIPGIIHTYQGSIIVYYECRKDLSDWAAIDIGMRKSVDGGKTFTERKILVYGEGKTLNNPVMFSDNNQITLIYQEEYSRTFVTKSFDDGNTWSKAVEITCQLKTPLYDYTVIACGPGHGTVLSNGRYIVPVWMALNFENKKAHHPSIISTIYSDDKGETWHIGELIKDSILVNPSETVLAETKNGIFINIRNENPCKRRATALSKNGISNWINLSIEDSLPDPTCAAGMISIGDDMYFSNCKSENSRENLVLSKSTDFGASWSEIKIIDSIGGYSDIATNGNNKIYIAYEHWEEGNQLLNFASIDI